MRQSHTVSVVSLTASIEKLECFELGHGMRGCNVSANAAFDARDGKSLHNSYSMF